MISVSGKKWQEIKVDNKLVEKFQQDHNFSKIVSQLIVSRNFDKDEIHLIKNNLKISNIFQHKPDFINSVKLIQDAIINKEKICILGDYDVDGSVATSLFIKFFEHLKNPYFYYIPDREKDGYGASKKLFKKLIRKKPNLIIMVDCGSTSVEAIDFLNENKIKSLIIDHHEIYKPYPKANAIINPKKDNGYNEYNYLCATALTFFFLEILSDKLKSKINLKKNLIYVLLATVCDVMPLRKLNRLISINALNEFNLNDNPLFIRIYHLINKKNKININDLGYLVGPILNAGGRLGKSNYATELLSTNNIEIIDKKAVELFNLNKKRREIETKILNSIDFKKIEKKSKDLIIYYNSNINEGLIGIIASRLKDHFNKPSIVITNSNNLLKGSARSVLNYNIGRAIKNSLDKNLIINGGGHNMAAGFSLEKKNLLNFEKFITKDYLSKNIRSDDVYKYDSELSTIGFNKEFYNDIKQIGPFGTGNPEPIFLLKKLKVIKSTIIENKHISCILKSKIGFLIKSISFNSLNNEIGRNLLNNKKYFNVIGEINENFWNNKKIIQLNIKDIIL